MKNAPAGVISFLNSNNVGWRADLFTFTLVDGSVFRWTTCDRDLSVGGNLYLARGAVQKRSNTRVTSKLEVDSIDIDLSGSMRLGAKSIMAQTVSGFFDDGRVQVDHIVGAYPGDLSQGVIKAWFEGRVAGADPTAAVVKIGVVSDLDSLNTALPKYSFLPGCGNAVYDPVCTLVKPTYTLAGNVLSSAGLQSITTGTPAITAKAASYFNLGVIAFTSGPLNGVRRSIKTWDGTTFGLYLPLPQLPAPGDTFIVYPGCDRSKNTCVTKYNNLVNFRGFPHIPTPEGGQ